MTGQSAHLALKYLVAFDGPPPPTPCTVYTLLDHFGCQPSSLRVVVLSHQILGATLEWYCYGSPLYWLL